MQSVRFKEKGFYRDTNNVLQPYTCQGFVSPDGPNPPNGLIPIQNTIYWIDGPGPATTYDGSNPPGHEQEPPFCDVRLPVARPVDSLTMVFDFYVTYSNSVLLGSGSTYLKKVYHYVKIHVGSGAILDRNSSKATFGGLPLNF